MDYTPSPSPYGVPDPAAQPQPPRTGRRGKRKQKGDGEAEGNLSKKVIDRNGKFAIVFAIVVAAVGGVVLLGATAPSTWVLQTTKNISAGTPVDVDSMLVAVAVDQTAVAEGALSATTAEGALELAREELDGMRVQYPLVKNQQVHADMFNLELSLSEPLASNERLMSIQANVANAVAGQIKPGDRVDIAATAEDVAGVVLSDVEVVSVTVSENQYQAVANQQTGENKDTRPEELLPGSPVPGIYVVRVPSADAPKLLATNTGADLTLIYRPEGADALSSDPVTAVDVICGEGSQLAACVQR